MDQDKRREEAIERIKAKRGFRGALFAYVVVNIFLVGVWAFTGKEYFWTAWSMLGWGIGMVMYGWQVCREEEPISKEAIRREMGGQS